MNMPVLPDSNVLNGLLGVAERVMELAGQLLTTPVPPGLVPSPAEMPEPADPGWYRDRDGDIWQKTESGWRLFLQRGVAADSTSTWDWADGHVRDYGPFVPMPAAR
ncbi:hypothetical protein BJY24_006683 [Nocardia transvalensis]|uniref:Uncharacterized protein n=1 Tax=Nocardia transvalensis TaxID=37333 RepID=A0A7W9PKB0_9NOCA|nr:hypothetical protein [Nocardia transvalensis]MBB5917771.1 hypothetical protein [Nocardia transvalensis]